MPWREKRGYKSNIFDKPCAEDKLDWTMPWREKGEYKSNNKVLQGSWRATLAAMLALCLLPVFAWGQTTAGRITGKVTDEKGLAIEAATVVLNNSLSALTDKEGHFTMAGVKAGQYQYLVSCIGYEEQRGSIKASSATTTLNIRLKQSSLQLGEVTVTAKQQAMGSRSVIGQDAVRHIQPKSVADILQLLPGALTVNPTLNDLAQANIREIGSNDNNAMGTAVILDGTPLSNDANMQVLSMVKSGTASSSSSDGMSQQTTAGRGVDLRTVSADNIESVEVIRGIPSVEYGNLTSGVVIVKTKTGQTPWEMKFKTDAFSKLAYAGKGFRLKGGGTMNAGIDWSQSYGDTRMHYKGYERITATLGYSNVWGTQSGHPLTLNVNASLYNNVNTLKHDPQMEETRVKYRNTKRGLRLAAHGNWQAGRSWLTALDYDVALQASRALDWHSDYVFNPDGVVTNTRESGLHEARILNQAYRTEYEIENAPINLFAQLKGNRYFQFTGAGYTNLRAGLEYRLDGNHGKGLTYDELTPPQAMSAQTLRPRSYKDIPTLHQLSAFVEDASLIAIGATSLRLTAGARMSTLLLNKEKSRRSSITVLEPRVNAEFTFLSKKNNSLIDKLSLSGGIGISNKMPPLLYLYPDAAYFDNVSLNRVGEGENSRLGLITTKVVNQTQNPDLKPANSLKWELGLNARIGKMSGYVTFFHERHRDEFGLLSQPVWLDYTRFEVPSNSTNYAFDGTDVSYIAADGTKGIAGKTQNTEIYTWSMPANRTRTEKYGIEYSWNFGKLKAIETSFVVDGAWFHIKRQNEKDYFSLVDKDYPYVCLMPAGGGSISDRVNTNLRLVTHIPQLKMVFTTTLQVVWYESDRSIYQDANGNNVYMLSADGTRYVVNPIGFYDRTGTYSTWASGMESDIEMSRMVDRYFLYSFRSDHVKPWAMLNFRLTKEFGRTAELSFLANNFLNMKKYHIDENTQGKSQIYPDMYCGAELKLKF